MHMNNNQAQKSLRKRYEKITLDSLDSFHEHNNNLSIKNSTFNIDIISAKLIIFVKYTRINKNLPEFI